jgi:hypothetical protein
MPVSANLGAASASVHRGNVSDGAFRRNREAKRLLLIWLLQQTPIGSVEGCPDRRFLRRYASFKPTSPVKRLASSTSRAVAGPMVSSALDADIGEPTNWQTNDAGSVLAAGTKSR